MEKCYIIILNYQKWEDTVACLRSVFASTHGHFTLIVADNNSNNQSLENIIADIEARPLTKSVTNELARFVHLQELTDLQIEPSKLPDLVLVQNKRNRGFGAGNNIVLRMLLEEDAYIWLLNPDMTIDENALSNLVHSAKENPRAIIGSVTRSFDKPETVLFYGGGKINYLFGTVSPATTVDQIRGMDYISGGSMFIHTSHLKTVGLLPEYYFLYWEETDWCYNALKKGFSLWVCLEAVCYDKVSTTIGKGFLSDYFYTRNALLFLKKYRAVYLATAIMAVLVRVSIRIVRGEMQRARGMTKGVIDFLTGARYENK
jgi:GT2 family glycosyltransferase